MMMNDGCRDVTFMFNRILRQSHSNEVVYCAIIYTKHAPKWPESPPRSQPSRIVLECIDTARLKVP